MSNSPRQEPLHAAGSPRGIDRAIDLETTRALFRPIVFMQPHRAVHPPSWLEHIPFAFWLIDVLRPRVFVELGTHAGNSYAAFAQAVQQLGFDSAGYAVDTWKGDPQAGLYGESVYTEWKAYHDARYTAFSSLVRTTFDDAVDHFADRSIDLLNIDGYHTTDVVTHDFNTWLPKMSARGVVLMHDINVRARDFGAWRAWQELRTAYPSFEFLHGHGLGVLAVGTDLPAELEWLLGPDVDGSDRSVTIRQFFARAGATILSQYHATTVEREADARVASEVEQRGRAAADHQAAVHQLTGEIAALQERLAQQSTQLTGELAAARDQLAGRSAELTGLQDHLAQRTAELTGQMAALQSELADRDAQLGRVEAELDERVAGAADLRSALDQADSRIAGLVETIARRDAAGAAQRRLAVLPGFALAAANRALAGTAARLRALAATVALARPVPSRAARLMTTLRELGLAPSQLARRPRRLSTVIRFGVRPRLFRDAHLIVQSGLFDRAYYARVAPDAVAAGANLLAHFVMSGGSEGRSPCLLFDSAYYLAQYPDVAAARANPLAHYLRSAAREDRNPHPLFSAHHYRAQLALPARASVDPLQHYVANGVIEGRSPHPLFDPEYYVESCGAAMAGVDPFAHFLSEGAAAGFSPHPLFDSGYYQRHLPPHERRPGNPLQHYLQTGTLRGWCPHPLFDPGFYRKAHLDVAASGIEPLTHFVTTGGREGRLPVPAFDAAWYLATYPDVGQSGANPLVHYVRYGWLEGRNPSARFDTTAYLGRYEDVAISGVNPLGHYLEHGAAEGRTGAPDEALAIVMNTTVADRVRLRASTPAPTAPAPRVVVCLSHVMPVAPRAGNEYRIHRMLAWLRRSGYVVIPIIAPTDGKHPGSAALDAIADAFGNAIVCLPDGRVDYVLRDVPDVLHSLDGELTQRFAADLGEDRPWTDHGREMLQMDRNFCSDALMATVVRLQSVLGPYVLLAEYIWMSRVLPLLDSRAFKIIDTIDVFSTRHEKVGQFGVEDLVVEPDAERMRLRRGDLAIAIQQNEREVLEALVPDLPVLTAGVDFEVTSEAGVTSGRQVLYVASDNPMNRHGLRDFLRFAWPRVHDLVPDAELLVVGGVGASVPVVPDGVSVLGRVDDLAPLYRRCRAVINPAVAGTGVKIKTLEALSYLRRVVAWPNGVDGLSPAVAGLCRTVEDWYAFSERLVEVLTDDAASVFSAEDAELLAREGSPEVVYAELGQALEAFFARPAASQRPPGRDQLP